MKKFLLFACILIALLLTYNNAYSFRSNVTILVKGVVLDEFTGKPVETFVEFKTSKGKRFKIKTNSLTGQFQQILKAGDVVQIKFYFWNVARKIVTLHVKDTIAYSEQNVKYRVKKLDVGRILFKFNLFKPAGSEFVYNSKSLIDSLKFLMRFSRNIKVEFRINAHDTYAKIKKFVPQKTKKRKKHSKERQHIILEQPDNQAIQELVSNRVAKIENLVAGMKLYKRKIKVKGDYSVLEANEGSNLDANFDFYVIVTEIDKTFK